MENLGEMMHQCRVNDKLSQQCIVSLYFEDFDARGGMPIATYEDGEPATTSRGSTRKIAKVTSDFWV